MNDIAIRVDNLGKMYRIGVKQERYKTFRDTVTGLFRPRRARQKVKKETFWALRNVSFEIKRGEVVGIIGRNGSGKSTLLKILSQITEPTEGFGEIHGRVGSLLEVGTGFHPELTGRENVSLNGAILGMPRAQISAKFDEIVAFAEVEKFIDTPVKHYSSGMYLRLAFAVAAHLETEILLVDEVLAVGDIKFQQKCLGKMQDVACQGRTVLFVSHNMSAIKTLCKTGMLIKAGTIGAVGDIAPIIYGYQTSIQTDDDINGHNLAPLGLSFGGIRISDKADAVIHSEESFSLCVTLRTAQPLSGYYLFCIIQDQVGRMIIHSRVDAQLFVEHIGSGNHTISVKFPALWLTPGIYTVQFKLMVSATHTNDRCVSAPLMIEVKGNANTSDTLGALSPNIVWNLKSN